MNKEIARHQKYRSIIRVFNNHNTLIDGKTEIQNALQLLEQKNDRISELISNLVVPVTLVYSPRRESNSTLREKLRRVTGLGILIAQKNNDLKLLESMKTYKKLALKCSAYKLYENALRVSEAITQYATDAGDYGFTAEELSNFSNMVTAFGDTLTDTGNQLNDRKAGHSELDDLFADCNKILSKNLDPFAVFVATSYPEFYREYTLLRRSPKRGSVKKTDSFSGEISGMVYNSATSEGLEGATVTLPDYNLVTETDEDGYYEFDELAAATYKVKVSMEGYEVPSVAQVTVTDTAPSAEVNIPLVLLKADAA